MEQKKNPKLELNRYYALFFSIGLSISLGLVVLLFEWKFPVEVSTVNLGSEGSAFVEIIEDIPVTQQDPIPPKLQQPKVIEVPDEVEIEEEIEVDLDIEMVEDSEVEQIVFEEAPEEEIAEEVFSVVEEMPKFPGGTAGFYEYVSNNLDYPRRAKKAKVEGKVILRFIVGLNGQVSDVEVVKGIGFDCDEEAMRIIQQSPNWTPGKQGGKNVKVRMIVPLSFQLS